MGCTIYATPWFLIFSSPVSFLYIKVQVLLDGAYRPTDFKCEITLFWGIKKDRATGSPLLGLVICYEIAQKGVKMPLKMQK